jgi:hypothetical protein
LLTGLKIRLNFIDFFSWSGIGSAGSERERGRKNVVIKE